MSDILGYIAALAIGAIVARLLPLLKSPLKKCSRKFINWRVNRSVKKAEKRFKGEKLGVEKKAWVTQRTQKYEKLLGKMDSTIDTLIEEAVKILNSSATSTQRSIKSATNTAVKKGAKSLGAIIKSAITKGD